MAGTNPYIKTAEYQLPTETYTLTVRELDDNHTHTFTVEPDKIPYQRSGLPGSVLDILLAHDIHIEHTCGGVCACSTCHVYVKSGITSCNESTDDEEDQLDEAPGLQPNSRLACQCVPDGTSDVVVEIPAWNRNAVKETPH